MREGTYAGFFSLYGMKKMQEMEVLLLPIFGYLLSSRAAHPPFLWMSSYTPLDCGCICSLQGAWVLRRHAAFAFYIEAGCAGDRSLFLLHAAAVDFLRAAVEKELQLFLSHTLPREDFSAGVFPYPSRRAKIDWIAMVLYCISGCAVETFLGLWSVKIFLKILTGA